MFVLKFHKQWAGSVAASLFLFERLKNAKISKDRPNNNKKQTIQSMKSARVKRKRNSVEHQFNRMKEINWIYFHWFKKNWCSYLGYEQDLMPDLIKLLVTGPLVDGQRSTLDLLRLRSVLNDAVAKLHNFRNERYAHFDYLTRQSSVIWISFDFVMKISFKYNLCTR